MSSPLPLRTERLVLRHVEGGDLDDLHAYYGDPEVCRYLPFEATDLAGTRERFEKFATRTDWEPSLEDQGLAVLLELDGRVVGDVMLRFKASDPRTDGEVGWVLNPAFSGRGLATEAMRVMIDQAFGHFGCHRVHAELDARNTASARLCERLGMTREAHLRQDLWGKGEWSDTVIYGLLRDEWPTR